MEEKTGQEKVSERVAGRAHESVDRLAGHASEAEDRIRREAAAAEARVRDAGERARERSERIVEVVDDIVRRNPMTSVALAFAAGALLSAWRTRD